jgi:serralysin
LEPTFNQDLNGDGVIGIPTTVIQTDGSTSLVQIGSNYFLYAAGGSSGPELQYGGAAVTVGQFGAFTPIGAVQVAGGYDIAWENASAGEYTVWNTNSNGNYLSNLIGAVAGNSTALEALEPTFNQDLNGDGVIGIPTSTVIQTDGSTSLVEVGSNYFLYAAGGSSGPELQYSGAAVTVGQFSGFTPIGAVQVAGGGYDVAWYSASAGEYTVWSTDSNGNYLSNLIGAVAGNSAALEALEPTFDQDLNGDGVIGYPVIQTDGSISLVEVGSNYFFYTAGGSSGPELQDGGAAVTVGQFAGWTPIGAVQVSGGYDIAWKNASAGEYTVWSTDSNGNYLSNVIGAVAGNSTALEALEPIFNQDLNGDGTIGLAKVVIQTDGTTALTLVGNNYFLDNTSSGTGPELIYGGSAVTVGQFGSGWTPIGAVQVAGGYDVAWYSASAGEYTVWSTDSNGNYLSNLIGAVAGNSAALEALEPTFNQDLNGDGAIGYPVIQTDGTTALTEVGTNFFLDNTSSGTGPELQYSGAAVTVGQFGAFTPIGAVQVAGGYDIAWENASASEYTVWNTNSNGNYLSNVIGEVAGNSTALEALEPIFNQDLNGDGVIGLYAAPGTTLQISSSLSGASGSATIGTGATLELAAADSASVTFSSSTGMLELASPATFDGVIFGFTGNGTLSGSDQIDLKGINFSSVQDSYANGVLTVTDGTNTAALDFNGSYVLANFKFASDGSGGTILYDPPVPGETASQTTSQIAVPTPSPIGAGGTGLPPSPTSSSIAVESQLNQLVQALATSSTGNSGLESIIASNAQLPNGQAPAMIGMSLH